MGNGGSSDVPSSMQRNNCFVRNESIHGIWVMVDTDRTVLEKASANFNMKMDDVEFGGGMNITNKVVHIANSCGFTKMLPGTKVAFYIGCRQAWVTIYYQERMVDGPIGPPVLVCGCFPTTGTRDLWVMKDNAVHND